MAEQKIKRSDFAKIYKIACSDWKGTLNEWLDEQKMEDEIAISDERANRMFSDADETQIKILLKIIKRPESIFSKVSSYEAALKLNGDKCTIQKGDTPDEVAYKKLKAIARALNKGKVIDKDFAMSNSYYANYFYFNLAGLGCVYSFFRVSNTAAYCGFRLCFFERDAANYAADNFKELYEQFYSA